jgi:hypothetical protein
MQTHSETVLSPAAILQAQATNLEERTKGVLEAEVFSREVAAKEGQAVTVYQFDVIAPALNRYRKTILQVQHTKDAIYPVYIQSLGPGLPQAANDKEFLVVLRSYLQSQPVMSLIQTLIARSNEAQKQVQGGQSESPTPSAE